MLADISTRKLAMLHAGNGARARANGNLCMLFMGVCCMLVIGMALRGDGERTGDEPLSRHAEETAAVGALGEAPGPSGPSSSNGPRIAGAITTCRRPLLFRRAMLSFRMRCLDCMPRVDRWFAVDDGSPPDQVADMQASVPGLTWVRKAATEAGHAGSLNALLQAVRGYDSLVFIEDDFFFVLDEEFVARALHVLDADASLGQVVFNERYALTTIDADRQRVVGGVPVQNASTGRMEYIVHEYVGDLGSPEWTAYIAQHPGKLSNVHWPHFSLHRWVACLTFGVGWVWTGKGMGHGLES